MKDWMKKCLIEIGIFKLEIRIKHVLNEDFNYICIIHTNLLKLFKHFKTNLF